MELLVKSVRRIEAITEKVIDRSQAGRVRVADPGDLDWGGLLHKRQKAVMPGVPGQIEKHVNPIGSDSCGKIRIGPADHVDPVVAQGPQTFSHRVLGWMVGIKED